MGGRERYLKGCEFVKGGNSREEETTGGRDPRDANCQRRGDLREEETGEKGRRSNGKINRNIII